MDHQPRYHGRSACLLTCLNFGAACVLLLAMAGCVSTTPVHVVQRGETLYSIAWQYGLNWHRLARWNNIQPPYTIYPGQRLRLAPPGRGYAIEPQPQPDAGGRQPVADAETRDPPSTTGARSPARPGDHATSAGNWIWPVAAAHIDDRGGVTESRKGINIKGEFGVPIVAARAGRVVYSGSGLEGYGNLVIIKHEGNYLSAYGFNSRLLVSEGDWVSAGEKIAEMGLGPGQTAMLHFEIRHDGQPLDVSRILPPRP